MYANIVQGRMYSSYCPICQLPIPTYELERHANSHFEDDELERDMQLAMKIALAPPSPPHCVVQNIKLYPDMPSKSIFRETSEVSTSNNPGSRDREKEVDEKICYIISLQYKATFYKVEGGLIALLKNCLESEAEISTNVISGYVDHFQSIKTEDDGWGCGWRNIQMAASHLLMKRPEARNVLFGGCGFVPDIGSLQRWLEVAWARGFDTVGKNQFGGIIYGSKKWIGTTECASLLRSFGLRARIVDFDGKKRTMNSRLVYGPMDKFVLRRRTDNGDDTDKLENFSSRKYEGGYQVLIDWVWSYFSEHRLTESCKHRVVVTEKMPLYFQHDGHSRTIVGVQVKHQQNGVKEYNLLILDPSHRTETLERSLRENVRWQALLKRGIHTLKKSQYQLCYVDDGLANGEEMEQLKTVDSVLLEF
ncbi:hypothetical protein Nepgr_010932 [Nepenthes gracilis]|uniref:UFSP1/2/DUB catalytic domain-containing protein n=1 Tax=Nepenthes gracilis TaxID=150966 RepID=A0AAD3SEC5_NEPGR|nr:hypothetical protein Nepgr_010932 [Nepenthes gracilis]